MDSRDSGELGMTEPFNILYDSSALFFPLISLLVPTSMNCHKVFLRDPLDTFCDAIPGDPRA